MLNVFNVRKLVATDRHGRKQAQFIHTEYVPKSIPKERIRKEVLGSQRNERMSIEHKPTLLLDIIV